MIQDAFFIFAYSINTDSNVFLLEQEGYSVEKRMVSGNNAELYLSSEKNMRNSIIWYDGKAGLIFYISAQLDEYELINLAEKVK